VSVTNDAGLSLRGARIKLVAGEVNRAGGTAELAKRASAPNAETVTEERDQDGFTEKSFAGYHLYTLGRAADLLDQSVKQLELFDEARGASVARRLVADSDASPYWYSAAPQQPRGVKAQLELVNDEAHGLGVPLPAGKVRVYQRDEDGALEFLGEDLIGHTPKGETVRLSVGEAFDVRSSRRLVSESYGDSSWRQTWEISLSNGKAEPVAVRVRERIFAGYARTEIASAAAYEREDAERLAFDVALAPGEEKAVTYTVTYHYY
jgi:hypothetical protein